MGPRKNASWAPSGDHVGHQPDVSHVSARDGTSMIAIRLVVLPAKAILRPSGEKEGQPGPSVGVTSTRPFDQSGVMAIMPPVEPSSPR